MYVLMFLCIFERVSNVDLLILFPFVKTISSKWIRTIGTIVVVTITIYINDCTLFFSTKGNKKLSKLSSKVGVEV